MEKTAWVALYMVMTLFFLFIAKKTADLLTGFDDDGAIEKEGNQAVALRRFGLYTGFAVAMAGVLNGGLSRDYFILFMIDGALASVVFFAAHFLNDYVILSGVRNNELIAAGNAPAGMVEAGSFIATGILLNGAFAGEEGRQVTALIFFVLGQVLLVLAVRLHQKIYHFDMTPCIKAGNMSAGMSVAGLLIAYSLILRTSITGDFIGWVESVTFFLITAIAGMAGLLLFQKVADFIFLPGTTIADQIARENTAAVIVIQGVTIALALVISCILFF